MAFVRAAVALASIAEAFTEPILLLALRSAAFVAVFFPEFCDFRASLGSSSEFSLLFLGFTFGVAFFAPPVFSPLSLSLSLFFFFFFFMNGNTELAQCALSRVCIP